jgi:hypothetical protein
MSCVRLHVTNTYFLNNKNKVERDTFFLNKISTKIFCIKKIKKFKKKKKKKKKRKKNTRFFKKIKKSKSLKMVLCYFWCRRKRIQL